MQSDYSGWNVKYHVNLEVLTNSYFERLELLIHSKFSVLLVHEEGDSPSLVLQIQNEIISYDIRSRRFIKLHDLSQEWLSIISSQDFIRDHYLVRNRSLPFVPRLFILQVTVGFLPKTYKIKCYYSHPSGLIPFKTFIFFLSERKFSKSSAPFETLAFNNDPSDIKIIHSCNGLFICRSYRTYYGDFSYYVYNPSTKCLKPLHPSPFRKSSVFQRICSVNMVYDPLRSNYYEVVFIWSSSDRDTFQIETYSSKTDSWRLPGDGFSAPVNTFCSPAGVYWNGSLHWINRDCSLYFNASKELLKTMPSVGRLSVHHSSATQFDILEMDIDYTGWTVKYSVDLEELTTAYPEMVRADYDFSILLIEEDEVSSNLLISIPDKIISYNLKEMSFQKLHDLPSIPNGGARVTAPRYSAYRLFSVGTVGKFFALSCDGKTKSNSYLFLLLKLNLNSYMNYNK
ncbi:hypothetical protein C5167_034994 [Papaver somniferum]|uniref:F-box associated beta-propeller type 1 domain-containing protein n=1 Tax=Papaver somniferum TaxID=3469 RepID=A0A4Y7KHL6_PAPSO|nr:hypothetical protein C5167_034994 [Papaver somniferum]